MSLAQLGSPALLCLQANANLFPGGTYVQPVPWSWHLDFSRFSLPYVELSLAAKTVGSVGCTVGVKILMGGNAGTADGTLLLQDETIDDGAIYSVRTTRIARPSSTVELIKIAGRIVSGGAGGLLGATTIAVRQVASL